MEKDLTDFIQAVIAEHKAGSLFKEAEEARLYYDGENPTINRYEKILYDIQGKAHQNMWTANHKIASSFFGFAVDQQTGYLLGNGVTFARGTDKGRLGRDFDIRVSQAAEYAQIGGAAFGFWNLDHVEVFEITEFAPLYDEENGALAAGVRFWQIDGGKPLRCTLYEPDGFTEYIRRKNQEMEILRPKRAYILHIAGAALERDKIYQGENYPSLPIVPLKNNRECRSSLRGKRNTIDALDVCTSNMVNNADEGTVIYWALQNCGGMDDLDAAAFLERVKTSHIAFMDNAEEGASAEPHAVEAPFAGTQAAADLLVKRLYQDFQAFDASAVTAGNQTATAIRASYVPLDLKCDKFERQVTEFIQGILKLAGIDDEPTYTRNQIVNKQEEMQTVLLAAQYLDEEYMTTKALTILGDADMAEDLLKRRAAEELGRFEGDNEPGDGGNETEGGEENEENRK